MITEAITLAGVALLLVIHAVIERKRRKPITGCNPHSDKHRTGDMAVTFWAGHFNLLHDEMRETRATQREILNELSQIKTLLQERR